MTTGYVVLDGDRWPLVIGSYGALWIQSRASRATVFAERRDAVAAIARSREYASARGYRLQAYRIVRLTQFLRQHRIAKDGRRAERPKRPVARAAGKKTHAQ